MSIENAEVLKLTARLVVGYLDEQNLIDAHKIFCETSRHLSQEEYLAFSQGVKTIDTSIGLVNIISEYFYIKNKLNDFIRNCPKTSLIIKLIDTSSFLLRIDLILKVLRENLQKISKCDVAESRKRKLNEDELFNVSNTNTSTPETVVHCSKRQRVSFSKPLITLSANKIETKEKVDDGEPLGEKSKKELHYISSPETSNKEDDVSEEEEEEEDEMNDSSKIAIPPPELLSETVLRKTDFVENLVEIINQTRSAKELEQSLEASGSPKKLTDDDFQEIISKTENDFEDILKEVIGKYLSDEDGRPMANENGVIQLKPEEIPLKQRLRPRTAKKQPVSERKKKKSGINIISNEVYTGPLPHCVQPSASSPVLSNIPQPIPSTSNQIIIPEPIESQSQPIVVNLVPMSCMPQIQPTVTTATFIPLSTFSTTSNIICESSAINNVEIPQNVQIILSEQKNLSPHVVEQNENQQNGIVEKTHQTPKVSIQPNFLASKCKSTPRRKQSHIRILDFNQTPSVNRLTSIKELKTPNSSGIKLDTPGSAPASITVTKTRKVDVQQKVADKEEVKENLDVSLEIIDESSNSNSISHTPKVAKNRRRRKIEIDVKAEKIQEEEESPKPMTREEWIKMRAEQKAMSVDDRMRILFQQQNEQKGNVRKRKTPKKKQDLKKRAAAKLKKQSSATLVDHQGKKLLCAKFKVTSPRKAALLKKTPKKRRSKDLNPVENNKKLVVNTTISKIDDSKIVLESLPKLNESTPTVAETSKNESESNDLNRSDTVQEVANLLTTLPETILAKTNSFEQNTHIEILNTNILMETPLKLDSMSPLPNTPRFAVPLVSIHQETPLTKIIASTAPPTAVSILKVCDILSPSFPITPGFKETPLKSDASPEAASASGYSSRRTDYSSCSSYYKPDESEDINQNLEMIIKQSRGSERDRNSQSESDGGNNIIGTSQEKKILGSAKKIECPGALERVKSFNEEAKNIPMPHYTMMDEEGLLSESMLTTASDESSSSSFTCSTCSTDPSSDENTLDLLNKSENLEDRDSEWHCDDAEIEKVPSNNSLVDEKTGEVRFPLRNWITPKKIEPELPKVEESKPFVEQKKEEEVKKVFPDLEAIKQRTLKIIKSESAVNARKIQPKLKKSNVKTFKLPPEQPKAVALTRRDQILQQNLTERPRPTPLKLISTTALSSSSSRRKNATPRKTIIIDELPKAPSPTKKTRVKSKSQERKKTETTSPSAVAQKPSVKPESVSLENISDNAVCHDDHPSLNISTSFNESSGEEEEEENTVVVKTIALTNVIEEDSNTFQRTLIAQGFDKKDAKDLQVILVDKIEKEQNVEKKSEECEKDDLPRSESKSETDDDDDDDDIECEFTFSDELEKHTFNFQEADDFKITKDLNKKPQPTSCPASKLQIDGKIIKIDYSDTMEIFSMDPISHESKLNEVEESKQQQQDKEKDDATKQESKILTKEIEIDKILTLIHGKH